MFLFENPNELQIVLSLFLVFLGVKFLFRSKFPYFFWNSTSLNPSKSVNPTSVSFPFLRRFRSSRISTELTRSWPTKLDTELLASKSGSDGFPLKIMIGIANIQKQKHDVKIMSSSRTDSSIFTLSTLKHNWSIQVKRTVWLTTQIRKYLVNLTSHRMTNSKCTRKTASKDIAILMTGFSLDCAYVDDENFTLTYIGT